MRRNIGSHTNRDTGSTVNKKVGITAGKNCRLILGSVEVGNEVYGIFIDIRKKFHGDLGKSCLGISHCRSTVTIHGTEVSMTVYKRISHGPGLSHKYQRTVNGAVTVRVILTHCVTDYTCTFSVRLVGTVIELYHGIENSSLNGL